MGINFWDCLCNRTEELMRDNLLLLVVTLGLTLYLLLIGLIVYLTFTFFGALQGAGIIFILSAILVFGRREAALESFKEV